METLLNELTAKIVSMNLVERVSAKTQQPYQLLVTVFELPNGKLYTKEDFLKNEESALLGMV